MKQEKIVSLDSLSLQEIDPNAEFIPLLSPEDELEMNKVEVPEELCILPLRNMVLFPGVVIPITAGRNKSIRLIEHAKNNQLMIGVVSQIDERVEEPTFEDIYHVGTIAKILKVVKLPNGNFTVLLQGQKRFRIDEMIQDEPFFQARVTPLEETLAEESDEEFPLLLESIKDVAIDIIHESPNIPTEATIAIKNIDSSSFLVNFVSSNLNLEVSEKQELLEILDLKSRAFNTLKFMNLELQKLNLKNDIQNKVRIDLDQQQKEYFLNQQIKTIQDELGGSSHEIEIEELKEKSKSKKWDAKVQEHFDKEISKMQRMNPQSPDFSIMRNYLDLMIDLPWEEYSKDVFDLKQAKKVLDHDHYGIEDVKKRILEHMAVLKLKENMKSPILLLVGPPGVGKTSLGKSVADALGRKYVRVSLGGLHDESEIRGHRKTYIGAMAGRILQSLKKAGTSNPVIVLDEIDKIGQGLHGDPSSALLEVLDPEQNSTFYDNYLEMGYDLSKVLFLATANSLSTVQGPLLDRMEIIQIAGYTLEEKIEIAKRHLISKQQENNGLNSKSFRIGNAELQHIIEAHTSESGVRTLEKRIASIARWVALQTAMENQYDPKITKEKIDEILGVPRPKSLSEASNVPGVVTGLAWTSVGGDILFIESITSKGKGNLTMTGNLGNVMKESATIALEYIKSKHKELSINIEEIESQNIHVHVPEGATPKDGPSAGIAMLTSMVSSFRNKKVKPHLAMTGEITLRGKVLPVGGIKEKLLAATRAGIKDVILCEANKKDVEEINQKYLKNMKVHYVNQMSEVLELALEK